MKKLLILVVVGACACGVLEANTLKELAFMTVMPAKESPVIDGELNEKCWKDGVPNTVYYEYLKSNPKHVEMRTSCTLVYDKKGLYLGIVNYEDHPELILRATVKNGQSSIYDEDIAEIYIDPDAKGVGYYRWAINANGKHTSTWQMDGANKHEDWRYGGVRGAAKVEKDHWNIEFFIPWEAFHGRPGAKAGDVWTFNHNRYRFRHGEAAKIEPYCLASSAPMASYLTPFNFGYLYFSDGSKPEPQKVLALLDKRVKGFWAIQIGDTTYMHDQNGTKIFPETIYSYMDRLAKAEIAENALYKTNLTMLATMTNKAEKIALPLAGTYEFRKPPENANGFCGWYRHNFPKNTYVTKHLKWGNLEPSGFWSKLFGGEDANARPKVLFITDFGSGVRRALDYSQRFGIEALFFPGNFGASGSYQDPLSHGGFLDKHSQFETLLAENPRAIFISRFDWRGAPNKYRYEILRRVRDEGVGLFLFAWGEFESLFARLPIDQEARRRIVSAAPVYEMKGLFREPNRNQKTSPSESAVKTTYYGKGRVVMINGPWFEEWSLDWESAWEGLFVGWRACFDWIMGIERKVKFDFEDYSDRAVYSVNSRFVSFRATADADDARVTARLRSSANEVLATREFDLVRGENTCSMPIGDDLPGGDYYLDVFAEVDGMQDAAAIRAFTKQGYFTDLTINSTNRIFIAENKAGGMKVAWNCNGVCTTGKVVWKLYDSPYRQLRRLGEVPFGKWSTSVWIPQPADPFPTLAGVMEVEVIAEDGRKLGKTRKVVYFPNHRFDDYTLISWSNLACDTMPPSESYQPVVEEFGYRNQLGGIDSAWMLSVFNCRQVPYSTRVCLGDNKDYGLTSPIWGMWSKKDEELSKKIGGWSPYNPAAQKEIERIYSKTVAKTAQFGDAVWSFGDECGFGYNLGFNGVTDKKDFADFLKQKYGTIARYNRAHNTNITDFAQAEHVKIDEACKRHDWPLWFDTVQFSERLYADTYNLLAKIVKKQDPQGRCGAEGSLGGDLELTVKDLKFWGPYRSLVEDELLRNVAPNHVRGIWWGGYLAQSLRDGFPVQQWEFVLTGTVNADQWYDLAPTDTESGIAGDLNLAPYVKLYLPHMTALRRGQAQLLIKTPMRPDPIAIYYSHPSRMISTRDDEFANPMDSLTDLIHFCYRHGFDVKMVTPRTLDKLKGAKALFLCGDTALSDAEVAAIKAFKKAGGIIASDVDNVGVVDEVLARRDKLPLTGDFQRFQHYRDDAEVLAFLAKQGIAPREAVAGLKGEDTILRVRQLGDMKIVGLKTHTKNRFNEVTIDLKGEGHVYEVLKGYVGKLAKIEMKPMGIPFRLFTVFPEVQSAPKFELPPNLMLGETTEYDMTGLRDGSVYRLEFYDPTGKELRHREEIFTVNLKAEKKRRLQFPYNDLPGVWTVRLTDVATGLATDARVSVK